jgi:hypothetical protein
VLRALDEATEAAYFFQKLGPHVAQFPDALFRLQRLKR